MSEADELQAWLERPNGERIGLGGNVSLGRTAANSVVLADERVSRRHAIIHPQGEHEFWLVDLGSRNGTYVNQRRVNQPIRLGDGDQIQVGPFYFSFRQPSVGGGNLGEPLTASRTLVEVRSLPCWLLVLDVEGSTEMAKAMSADELAMVMGQWFLNCKQLIESQGGTVNKYLGDGLLAYWRDAAETPPAVAKALESLRQLQLKAPPPFRFVLHLGQVTFGGVATLGEESLSGSEVNFAFRMEKVAGSLRQSRLLSDAAATALQSRVTTTALGEHPVPSFEGTYRFFGV